MILLILFKILLHSGLLFSMLAHWNGKTTLTQTEPQLISLVKHVVTGCYATMAAVKRSIILLLLWNMLLWLVKAYSKCEDFLRAKLSGKCLQV